MSPRTPLRLLLVEDNPGDVDLVLEVFADAGLDHVVEVAVDGMEALARLSSVTLPIPDLVILDLNLPKRDGRELLRDIKSDPRLLYIPVVVFSSSEAHGDLTDAYRLHANCFVKKPADLDEFIAAVRGIDQFWMQLVKLPPPGSGMSSDAR